MAKQNDDPSIPPIEIPIEQLSVEAVAALIDSFILREGTDYGLVETSLEAKRGQIRRQLDKGQIKIVFDGESESVTLLNSEDWKKLSQNKR